MTTELFVTPVWTWLNVILSNIAFVVIENYNKLVVFLFLQTTPSPNAKLLFPPAPRPMIAQSLLRLIICSVWQSIKFIWLLAQ